MRTTAASLVLVLGLASVPFITSADTLSDLQAQVAALSAQLKALTNAQQGNSGQGNGNQTTENNSDNNGNSGNGNSNPGKAPALCVDLKHTLALDDEDAATDGEITKLQKFFAAHGSSIYPEARITGYFGPATMRAVQRWQAKNNIVSSGDPDTTGYGYVGTKTRLAMGCTVATQPNTAPTTPTVVTTPTPTATTTPPVLSSVITPPTSVTQPAIISLTADPKEIKSIKDSSLISWRTQNFKSCSLIYSIYQKYAVGYAGVKVLTTSYTDSGSFVVSPATLVEGTDNPAYMAVFVTLVCRDRFGGEKRASVRFGPGAGYPDWQSLPNPWADEQAPVTPPVVPPTTTTPTQTTNGQTSGSSVTATGAFDISPLASYSGTSIVVSGSVSGANTVSIAVDTLGASTRLYTSPSLSIVNGRWCNVISTSLPHGLYRISLIADGTVIVTNSLLVDLNPHAWFTTPSGTTYTAANPTFSGTSTNMSLLEYGYVASNAPGGIEDTQIVGTVPVTNNAWTFTLNRTFTNGEWVAMTLIPSTHQPLSSIGFTMNLPEPVVLGTYVGYRDGSMFNTTSNISQADALSNCQLNATNNPSQKFRCFWNDAQIFDNSGVTCANVSQASCQAGYTQSGGGFDSNNCQVAITCVAISAWSAVTITPNKTTYVGGETSSYSWSVATTAPSTPAFALTIVPSGMTMPNSTWPQPVNPYISMNGAKTGSNTLLIPWTAGSYDFLVYTVSGNVEVARGPLLTVTQPTLPSASCPAGVTCPNFWVRPGHGPAVCQKYTSQQSYAVTDTRVENCSGTFCVSPAFLYATQAGNVISDLRQADLPADKTLHKIRCNAACTDAAGCAANSVASASTDVSISNLASALVALQSALAALMALMGR